MDGKSHSSEWLDVNIKGQRGCSLLSLSNHLTGYMAILTNQLPPWEVLDYLFFIDVTSPSGLRWKNPKCTWLKQKDIAGTLRKKNKYWQVQITHKQKSKIYFVHRIIYCLKTKQDPGLNYIDHQSNKQNNLKIRQATPGQNQANRNKIATYANKKVSSQYKGVTWDKNRNKWMAAVMQKGVRYNLGRFEREEEAAHAYDKKAKELWGDYANINFPNE